MDPSDNEESVDNDRMLNAALAAAETEDEPTDNVSAKFLARLEDHELEALDLADAHEACIARMKTGLFRIAHYSEKNLITAIESGMNLLSSPDAARAVNMHLAILRQAERFVNVEARLLELRQPPTNPRSARGLRPIAAVQRARRNGRR
jgi:hypothetical protein